MNTYHGKRVTRWVSTTMHVDFRVVASPYLRESKTVLESEFRTVDSGFQLLDSRSFSMKLGLFRIPIVSGMPDSKVLDTRFHMQKFPGRSNSDSLTWGELHHSGKSVQTFSIKFSMGNRKLQTAVSRYAFEVSRCRDFKFKQGVQFSSFLFSQNIIRYKNTYRNC